MYPFDEISVEEVVRLKKRNVAIEIYCFADCGLEVKDMHELVAPL